MLQCPEVERDLFNALVSPRCPEDMVEEQAAEGIFDF